MSAPASAAATPAAAAVDTVVVPAGDSHPVAAKSVSAAWRKEGPPLVAAFEAVTAAGSNPAELNAAYAALSARLLLCLRGGVFRCMQAELPGMFAKTGRPHRTLHELLVRLQPRISAPPSANKNNNAGNRNNGARALPKAAAQTIAPAVAAEAAPTASAPAPASASAAAPAAALTNTVPLPASLSSSWFGALVARTSFVAIGSTHHHSLQVLLLQSVDALRPLQAPEEERTYAREVLLPQWLVVPCITQHILTVYGLIDYPAASASASASVATVATARGMDEIHYYFQSLQSCGHHADALSFLAHFGSAALSSCPGGLVGLLTPLLKRSAPMGWDMQAVDLANDLPILREPLIRLLTTLSHKSPQSLKCIQRWEMDPALFPEVTHDLSARQLRWLVREGKAEELGAEVCAGSPKLQDLLVRELLFAGDLELAQSMLSEFGLQRNEDLVAELQQHLSDRAKGLTTAPLPKHGPGSEAAKGPFLHLPATIPITFVTDSDPSSLDRAALGLSAEQTDMVGLDVEFGFTGSSSAQPALLQIATRAQVFLFDLLCFDTCARMGEILQTMFRDARIRKVGYAWDGDWRVLHGGFPRAAAFALQTNIVDMADPARALDRLEALKEAQAEQERIKLARAEQNRINEQALAEDIAAGRVVVVAAAPQPTVAVVRNNNVIHDAADQPSSTPSASAEPPTSADPLAVADDDEDMDDATPSISAEPTNVRAVCAAAKGVGAGAGAGAADMDGGSGCDAPNANSNASPSREDRRRAKKVAKKAARSPAPSAASASSASGAAGGEDDAPVVRKGIAKGLSSLAHMCLGLPLDKHFQVSAWRRRPLKPEQMQYAALDAFCLLGIYDAFFVQPLAQITELGVLQAETFAQYTPIPNDASAATATAARL